MHRNTCYLNSILQYLYTIKPLREAVLIFEQDKSKIVPTSKSEVERAKRCELADTISPSCVSIANFFLLVVRQLRLLFLQLYKTELPAVRPDEELAYLAITRPEIDSMVEQTQEPSTELSASTATATDSAQITPNLLDSIPSVPELTTLPSPSSTIFASPPESPRQDLTGTPIPLEQDEITEEMELDADKENIRSPESSSTRSRDTSSTSTILGKRGNQDRERDNSRSPGEERVKYKQAEGSGNNATRGKSESESALEFELGTGSRVETTQADQVESPSLGTATEIAHLELTTPAGSPSQTRKEEAEVLALTQPEDKYESPSAPPSLPPRPQARKQETLSSGLRFGEYMATFLLGQGLTVK